MARGRDCHKTQVALFIDGPRGSYANPIYCHDKRVNVIGSVE